MVGGGSGGTGDWEIGSMAVAGARPPGTHKGYAANGGRRAAAPTGCSIDRRADEEKGIQADSITRPATAERGIRQVENHQPPLHYAA